MIKLLVICPVFREARFCERWRLLAQLYPDVDVTLLAPRYWEWRVGADSFGENMVWRGKPQQEERFRVKIVAMPQVRHFGWFAPWIPMEIARLQPDMVYYIGHDMEYALSETILAAKVFASKAKVVAFTMRGFPHKFARRSERLRWKLIQKYCSAMFCHYPDARQLIINDGFPHPIYIQTQIGVDTRSYFRDEEERRQIRLKYGLGDAFVFGSTTRLTQDKGILEILRSLPCKGNWKYLLLGSGPSKEETIIRAEVARLKLTEQVVFTGYIDWKDIRSYLSAMDCLVHVPKTTPNWIDTFPVAVVQGMACTLPIIANTSGAMRYQLGEDGIIVPEGDQEALSQAMQCTMANPENARCMGSRLRARVLCTFDITHLSHCFHATMCDIIHDVYDPDKIDQTQFETPRDCEKESISSYCDMV